MHNNFVTQKVVYNEQKRCYDNQKRKQSEKICNINKGDSELHVFVPLDYISG